MLRFLPKKRRWSSRGEIPYRYACFPAACTVLVDQGHDAVHAVELGLSSATDDVILDWARKDHRIVITADLDYPRILALSGAEGPGLILFRGGNYSEGETVDRLAKALESVPGDQFQSAIVVIEKTRIRRRELPI